LFFLVGVGAATTMASQYHLADVERQREEVRARIEPVRAELSRELFAAIHLTQGIASLVTVDGEIPESRFRALAAELIGRSTVIRNIALAPNNIVRGVFPMEGNQKALGFAYATSPDQWPSVQRMMAERRIVVAGPVPLVQGGQGVIARTPITIHDRSAERPDGRYWGLVSTVIDFPALIARTTLAESSKDLRLAMRGRDGTGANGPAFYGDPTLFDAGAVLADVSLPSGSWQMAALPTQGWLPFHPFRSKVFLFGSGLSLVLALLLLKILHVAHGRTVEVERRRMTEAALLRSNRALRLFSLVKGAVVRAKDEDALLAEVCRISVEVAGYRMAWIGRAEHDEHQTVRPITFAGPGKEFLAAITVRWGDGPEGQGTAGRAIRTRAPAVARDLLTTPSFAPWRAVLKASDFATALAVPLVVSGDVFGVLVIYAAEADAFDDTEIGLLEDLGSTISYGMEAIRLHRERDLAHASLAEAHARLEERVLERTHELSVAKEAAESADRLKSTFLATMSHELRTPLNSIIGFTGIMLQGLAGALNPEQGKQLGMVQSSARHLLALINDILDISKIEAGQLTLSLETFDIRDSITACVSALRPLADRKGLRLHTEIAPGVGPIRGDRRRIEQILLNLVGNALKFTDQGEVGIAVALHQSQLQVTVRDTGIGIAARDITTLFQPFRQVAVGLTRKHEGTGLGLSICRRLVELMGGSIGVESTPGVGSTFSFTVSAEKVAA
jgi:signal transduction histidine kinase/sensor domain CHASE-containing protein